VEAELQLTAQKIHSQEQQLEYLASYTAAYDRDKAELAVYRIKRAAMIENQMQTDNPVAHQSVQTEFFAPPVSHLSALPPTLFSSSRVHCR
jgi:hypothetical protein